eukprot:9026006-Pyramimonas_sp.AAC.1
MRSHRSRAAARDATRAAPISIETRLSPSPAAEVAKAACLLCNSVQRWPTTAAAASTTSGSSS